MIKIYPKGNDLVSYSDYYLAVTSQRFKKIEYGQKREEAF